MRPAVSDRVPSPALWLGAAGALPFIALALAVRFAPVPGNFVAETLLTGYGIVILSFMGGVHWGLAMRDHRAWQYAASVVPALYAWPALWLSAETGWLYLAAGFALLLAFDFWSGLRGWTPFWYARLRPPLTLAAVGSLLFAALLA